MYQFFDNIFRNNQTPVIVCEKKDGFPICYFNASAMLLINPSWTTENLNSRLDIKLEEFLNLENKQTHAHLQSSLFSAGYIGDFRTRMYNHEGDLVSIRISSNMVNVETQEYFVIYLMPDGETESMDMMDPDSIMPVIFHAAYQTQDSDEAINKILGIIGSYSKVSRVYIFEELPDGIMTRNTYEWCADGVEPAIQDLQNLRREDYNYDAIIQSGAYITNDVRELPDNDREILEMQGIKSLAILSLYSMNKPIGYIGFDDCNTVRIWGKEEIQLLNFVCNIIVALIERRNSQAKVLRSLEILQTITDNIDSIIYVTDIHTYDVIFINNTLAKLVHTRPEDIIGHKCWKVLQRGKMERCEFCPVPKMLDEDGGIMHREYSWEFQNTITGKWYLIKDTIVPWIDGRDVHIETATDITGQKEQEEQLRYFASVDTMTGAYNREWGYKIIRELSTDSADWLNPEPVSLCFVDLDGLKITNDTYGHDAGDDMILSIMDVIRQTIRKSDAICRWGGDEFLLLLKCKVDVAEKIMQKITEQLKAINESGEKLYKLSFSYGIVPLDVDSATSIDMLISEADKKMYEQKMAKRK